MISVEELLRENKQIFRTGIEREGLRMTREGVLADTPHPAIFGEKLKNYHIKTDFCESQPELVTLPCASLEETYVALEKLTEEMKKEISKSGEILWSQSMPCILPDEARIKTSIHPGDFAMPLREYLECVRQLYGAKIQTICGIHFNISLHDAFFEKAREGSGINQSLRMYKDEMYLKIVRNYTRYHWFVLLVMGASPVCHTSFGYYLDSMIEEGEILIGEYATSLRMSHIGYQNKKEVNIDYTTLETFTKSIQRAVAHGDLIDEGALFAPIKLKAKDNVNYVKSLQEDGVLYIELRDLDLNPFDPNAFAVNDMKFLQLFIAFMLSLEETEYEGWQTQAEYNAYQVAEFGRDLGCHLLENGREIVLEEAVNNLCKKLCEFNEKTEFMKQEDLRICLERAQFVENSYSARILHRIKKHGFIKGNLME
ncbi:MAG: hypothetical protein R3Y47_10315 [Lachnospiraceae bacterium]